MIVKICEIAQFTRSTPGSSLVSYRRETTEHFNRVSGQNWNNTDFGNTFAADSSQAQYGQQSAPQPQYSEPAPQPQYSEPAQPQYSEPPQPQYQADDQSQYGASDPGLDMLSKVVQILDE